MVKPDLGSFCRGGQGFNQLWTGSQQTRIIRRPPAPCPRVMGRQLGLAIQLCLCLPLCAPECSALPRSRPIALFQGPAPQRRQVERGGDIQARHVSEYVVSRKRLRFWCPASLQAGQGPICERGRRFAGVTGTRLRAFHISSTLTMRGGEGEGGGTGVGEAGKRIKVVVISGPTGVGKSALAERLALSVDGGGEIISADSVQVYTGMDIGSNKPTAEERAAVPYHLIDLCPPNAREYSAANFAEEARTAILDISARGKLPIVVGGTGFYLQWLVYGRPGAPEPSLEAAQKAQTEVDACGGDWDAAMARIRQIDDVYAEGLAANDWFRARRVLEVWHTSGKPLSSFDRPQGKKMSYAEVPARLREAEFDFRCFFLCRPRLELFRDIDARCESMLERGLLAEVAALVHDGVLREGPEQDECERAAEKAIGYRQALDMLYDLRTAVPDPGEDDARVQTFVREFQAASRQFVKRQLTWFRSDPTFRWLAAGSDSLVRAESSLSEPEFHELYSCPEEQVAIRQAEENKESKRALKQYITKLAIYDKAQSRGGLLLGLRKAGLL